MSRQSRLLSCIFLLGIIFSSATIAEETVYFVVGDAGTPDHNESYVLPLTEADDIAEARAILRYNIILEPYVLADIGMGPDGINRNYTSSTKAPWNWHVTEFNDFVEVPPSGLNGHPSLIQNDLATWMNDTGGQICFGGYSVIAELGIDVKSWRCDFDSDSNVAGTDYAKWATDWRFDDCNAPDWCGGKDLTQDGAVDYNDLAIFADNWLDPYAAEPIWWGWWISPENECWNNPRQCHGDADGLFDGKDKDGKRQWVTLVDLEILVASWGSKCGDEFPDPVTYYPCADFDRDCDVDDHDGEILMYWISKTDVPNDCPTDPCL